MGKDKGAAPEAVETKSEGGSGHEKKKQPRRQDDAVPGMVDSKAKKKEWTLERLSKAARRFESEDAWKHGAPSSYKAAHARGLVAQCLGRQHGRRVG